MTKSAKENNTNTHESNNNLPSISTSAVLQKSVSLPDTTPICRGFDFNTTLKSNNKDKESNNDDVDNTFLNHIGISSDKKSDSTVTKATPSLETPPSPCLLNELMSSFSTMGFQATKISKAIDQINAMRSWRLSDKQYHAGMDDSAYASDEIRKKIRVSYMIFMYFHYRL